MISNKISNKIKSGMTLVIAGSVLVLTILFFVLPKEAYSENENRYLANVPEFSMETVVSGQYMEELDKWLADHFPMRDFFVGLRTRVLKAIGKKEVNGIYFAADDYLIEKYEEPKDIDSVIDRLQKFADTVAAQEQDRTIQLMLIPTAAYIEQEKLPKHVSLPSQMETAKKIYSSVSMQAVDCSEALMQQKETGQLYYRTDHHWTTLGAYAGYLAFCEANAIEPIPREHFETEKVTASFQGTLYSKVNAYWMKGDDIILYRNPTDKLTVSYEDTGEVSDSLYALEYVQKKDKYSLFLNNLHAIVEITNDAAASDKELVVIKDSFANSMIPFLTGHYRKIYVLDTRYYKNGPSAFLAEHEAVTDVLILYNLNTIDTDTGIRGIY